MKKIKSLLGITAMVILCTAFSAVDDILEKLGVQKQDAAYAIMHNLTGVKPPDPNCSGDCGGSRLIIPRATSLGTIINGDKKAAARDLCEYIKSYIESAAFYKEYQGKREAAKPYNEQPRDIDPSYAATIQKMVTEYEGEMKKTKDPKIKEMYANIISGFKQQLKEASDPTPLTTAWKEKYPETVDSLIRRQLNYYLAEQATVDFAAQTILKGKTKYFVKQEYERKSRTWKAIYRAGKDVNEVVKAFVKDWLQQGSKQHH